MIALAQIEKGQIEIQITDLINDYIKKYKLQFDSITTTELRTSDEKVVKVNVKVDFKI